MGSPAPNISVLFTASTSGYDTLIESVEGSMVIHGCLRRRELVSTVFAYIEEAADPRLLVRIYANTSLHEYNAMKMMGGSLPCYSVGSRTIAGIVDGSKTVDDLLIGEVPTFLETQTAEAVSRFVPIRKIPGTNTMECAVCGTTALKGAVPSDYGPYLSCLTFTHITPLVEDEFRGLCVDLVETAERNPFAEHLYVNQPWNPTPPWMSREDLFRLLEEDRNG